MGWENVELVVKQVFRKKKNMVEMIEWPEHNISCAHATRHIQTPQRGIQGMKQRGGIARALDEGKVTLIGEAKTKTA